jgi:GTP-binding protein
VFEATSGVRDLSALADRPHLHAEDGKPGGASRRTGASGADLVIQVPEGTMIFDEAGLMADLVGDGPRAVVARGGRGGRGNVSLASRRNRVPRTAEAGEPGEERRVSVELRIVADVGLVGMPNAGKSTLLGRLTAARPKVAPYPFTTLHPNLGVAEGESRFVVADVPGLVEGAHEGKGLGHRFLRHLDRARGLVVVVDLSSHDPATDLQTVWKELQAHDPGLAARPWMVVGTKADLVEEPEAVASTLDADAVAVSGLTGEGIDRLADRVARLVEAASKDQMKERQPFVVLRPARPRFVVRKEGAGFRVVGRAVERWVAETDFEDPRKVVQLQKRLAKEGVERQLAALGARRGDEVLIGERAFEFLPENEG